MYDNILMTTDGSEESETALEHAESLADRYDAELHVLYVSDVRARMGDSSMSFVIDNLEEIGQDAVSAVGEKVSDSVSVTKEVRTGIPHEEILEYVEDEDIDLVVMSTHGRSGIDRMLIGSVTEKVVRKSEKPVLTVPIND